MTCDLCHREVPATTVHHLVPKQHGRRRGQKVVDLPTADLCHACHKQIHRLFDNRELGTRLTNIPALREEPGVATFLDWVRKQPGEKKIRVK